MIARQSSGNTNYYHFYELGSTRLITDGSGNVADRCTYDAYGSVISHDKYDYSINQPYQYVGQLGYYTHWQIPDFGWLQLGVRFYDPQIGRFERRDILGWVTSPMVYAYAADLPLRFADPLGLCPEFSWREWSGTVPEFLTRLGVFGFWIWRTLAYPIWRQSVELCPKLHDYESALIPWPELSGGPIPALGLSGFCTKIRKYPSCACPSTCYVEELVTRCQVGPLY